MYCRCEGDIPRPKKIWGWWVGKQTDVSLLIRAVLLHRQRHDCHFSVFEQWRLYLRCMVGLDMLGSDKCTDLYLDSVAMHGMLSAGFGTEFGDEHRY